MVGHWCYWRLLCIPPDPATCSVAQQQFPCLTLGTWVLALIILTHTTGGSERRAPTHLGKFQEVLNPTEGWDPWWTGGLQDTIAPPWPCGDSVPSGQGCTQTPSAQTITGTPDPVGRLCMSGPSPMAGPTMPATSRPECASPCFSPTVPHPRRPDADLLACLMPPLRPPIFPRSPWLLRPRRLSSPQPSLWREPWRGRTRGCMSRGRHLGPLWLLT